MEDVRPLNTPEDFKNMLKEVLHSPQPHTDAGERGDYIVNGITIREIAACVLRGMLDGATKFSEEYPKLKAEDLDYHNLLDIIYEVTWIENFDPVAIQQNVTCHIEKSIGIFPNIPPLKERNE